MGVGKYSPNLPNLDEPFEFFRYNAKGEIPPEYNPGVDTYDEEIHFGDCDPDGFDRYGYSAYDADGKFVGSGRGIDRDGTTEDDYVQEHLEELRRENLRDYE
jgi:hypothetical protein